MKTTTTLFCVMILGCAAVANGQDFESTFGSGVHQFFSGQQTAAIQSFDTAIATKSTDPRPYYFRGLARMRSGDTWSAKADFAMGAQVEATTNRRSSLVNRSLERVQGSERMLIEKARTSALSMGVASTQTSMPAVVSNVVNSSPIVYSEPIYSGPIYSEPVMTYPTAVTYPSYPMVSYPAPIVSGCGTPMDLVVGQQIEPVIYNQPIVAGVSADSTLGDTVAMPEQTIESPLESATDQTVTSAVDETPAESSTSDSVFGDANASSSVVSPPEGASENEAALESSADPVFEDAAPVVTQTEATETTEPNNVFSEEVDASPIVGDPPFAEPAVETESPAIPATESTPEPPAENGGATQDNPFG